MKHMRTINTIHRDRLVAEAEEADTVGLNKIAEHLTRQVEKTGVRDNVESYTYAHKDFDDDVQELLWGVVVRTADFHDAHIDSEKAQKLVEKYAEFIVSDLRKVAKIPTSVGAFEPNVPGETREHNVIEIDED